MNDICGNFFTATEGTLEPKGVTAQSYIRACDTWIGGNSYPGDGNGIQLDTGELARRVAEEIKGQLGNIVRPEIEGKYKIKHR